MDIERLLWAIRTALISFAQPHYDPDDLQDLADFLASEVEQSNVILPTILPDDSKSEQTVERTIEDIEALPITSILGPHLVDMLDISLTHIPLVIDEILDNYTGVKPLQDDAGSEHGDSERQCELCERAAVLTDHHLIPRSEHDLFVKRGVFTLNECRTRLAKLCRPCHSAVHRAKSTRELATEYNTTEKLLEIPEVARFAEWNAKRKVMATVVHQRRRR